MPPVTRSEDALLKRDWQLLAALTFLFAFGFAIYNGVFQNFLRDVIHAEPKDLGVLESFREIPGLLTAITAGTLMAYAQSRVAALGLAVTGIGIAATMLTRSLPPLIAACMFWSVGFHLYSTVAGAITLALAKGKEGGRHLGRIGGIGASATLTAFAVAWLATTIFRRVAPDAKYHTMFLVGGISILGAAALCSMLSHHAESHSHLRIVVRKEYRLYYLLTFLEGCRRQIFSIFATFVLIKVYKVDVDTMLLLMLVNQILISFSAPAMGRIVDKVGERKPLTVYAIGLILVFTGYASLRGTYVLYGLYALYIIDNVLFSFGVGFTTYLNRIVRKNELRPCLAMGTTMNHIAAVTVPITGAYLWQETGNYQIPFWAGTAIAVVSLIATRFLPYGPPPKHEEFATVTEPPLHEPVEA